MTSRFGNVGVVLSVTLWTSEGHRVSDPKPRRLFGRGLGCTDTPNPAACGDGVQSPLLLPRARKGHPAWSWCRLPVMEMSQQKAVNVPQSPG